MRLLQRKDFTKSKEGQNESKPRIESLNGEEKTIYNVVRTLSCVYFAVSLPFRIAFLPTFELQFQEYAAFLVLDCISSIVFVIDSWQSFSFRRLLLRNAVQVSPTTGEEFTGNGHGSVRSLSKMSHGIKGKPTLLLLLSMFACLPLEYASLVMEFKAGIINYLMLNRVIIVMRLPSYIEDLADYFEARGLQNIGIQRAWKLFFAMAIAGHWCCCVFFAVGKMEAMSGDLSWTEDLGILERQEIESGKQSIVMIESVTNAYIQSLYWAYITMITTGFGDITPLAIRETVWCIVSMSVGVVITTCAIANLQLLVTNADAAFAEYQRKTETVAKYMKYRRLPNELQDRIMAFYRYQWDLLRGADEMKFLNELPSSIQQQVSNFLRRDLIASLPLLRRANLSLLNALAECVEINIYAPNDEIVKRGDTIMGALLVSRGEAEVLNRSTVVRKMRRLDNFAPESLFSKQKSEHSVRGRTFCEIFLLPSNGFQQIIHSQCDKDMIEKMKETALLMSKNASKVNKLFGSADDHVPTGGLQRIFYPQSTFRYIWDLVILAGCIFYTFSVPLQVMRYLDGAYFRDHVAAFSVSYFWDLCFVLDLYLNFNHFMHLEEGLVVFDRYCIRQQFAQEHNIILDFIASMPIDLLGLINHRWCFLLRLTKLLRLPQTVDSFGNLERVLTDFKLDKGLLILKISQLNFALVVTCHWIGCLWHSCANISLKLGHDINWLKQDEEDPTLSIDHDDLNGFGAYLRSVYWAIVGTSTVGYGDIIPTNIVETTFATVIILFGGLVLPAIVGGLAVYLTNIDLAQRAFLKKMQQIKKYMRKRGMSKDVIEKVVDYYDYLWSRQGALDEEEVLNELPPSLRQEVAIHINRVHIEAVPFLRTRDDSFKDLLGLSLRIRIFMRTDNIIVAGEMGSSMYFMEKGEAAVVAEDNFVHCILRQSSYFGEGSLLSARESSSTVKALTFCDVFELNRDDFLEIVAATLNSKSSTDLNDDINSSLKKSQQMNGNIMANFRDRPKCKSRVSREFLSVDSDHPSGRGKSKSALNPDNMFCFVWNLLLLAVIIYHLWMVPFLISFDASSHSLQYINYALDCVLAMDMYLSCCKFGFHREGELVLDYVQIKARYTTSRLKLDVLSIIPFDLVYTLIFSGNGTAVEAALCRLPKMLWIMRLPSVLNTIFRFLEDIDTNLAPLKLVEFLSGVVLIAHWAGCGFYATARLVSDLQSCNLHVTNKEAISWSVELAQCRWKNTWIERQMENIKLPIDGGETMQRYLRAINWALPTLVVVVIGDVVPVNMSETLYAFIWMIVGVSVNAAIIGNVANIVANIDTETLKFAKKADETKKFVNSVHLSSALMTRIDSFMFELWEHESDVSGDTFLVELPKTLQIQVTEKSRYWHVSHCPFFDFCSTEIVKALSLRLKLMLYSNEDVIVSFGDTGVDMFFLETGTVEIMSEDNKTVFATLAADSSNNDNNSGRSPVFFGETGLFFKKKRSGTVRAITFCETYRLHKSDLDAELGARLGRDFDVKRMFTIFTSVASSNERRNNAVTANLNLCRIPDSKLSKLIDPDESVRFSKQVPLWFRPASSFRILWDIICISLVLSFAFEIPFRASFLHQDVGESTLTFWMIVDIVIEVFFIVELYLRLHEFPIVCNGVIVTDVESIRNHHMKHGIVVDALSSIPVILITAAAKWPNAAIIRIWHMCRVLRLSAYTGRIEGYLNLVNVRISAASRLLSRVIVFYIIVIHWFGCIWFCIHRFQATVQLTWATTDCPSGGEFAGAGCLSHWLEDAGRHDGCHGGFTKRCYIRAVYFVLTTMSTVGYGDISPVTSLETIFQNVVVLTGACFFAGIIGSFAEFLSHGDESGFSAFKTKLRKLEEYMKYRQLPASLQHEILFYHKSRWNRSHVLEEKEVTSMLSEPLQMDVSFEMLSDVVLNIPILKECSLMLLKRICHALSLQMCPKNTTIYHAGDIGWDLYFIGAGLVKVKLPQNLSILDEEGRANIERTREKAKSVGVIYRPGNHFGESCLESITGVRRESTIATTEVELYLLSKENLDDIFTYTPSRERERLQRNLLSRNGNVWHSFDEQDTTPKRLTLSQRRINVGKSPTSFLSRTKPQRISVIEKDDEPPDRKEVKRRLRSFSAEASTQALEWNREEANRLAVLHEHKVIAAAELYRSGKLQLQFEKCESSESESSFCG